MQIDGAVRDPSLFPLRQKLGEPCLDVTLAPGDGLRIRAFWFHHVEALDPGVSVSLNAFSGSGVASLAAECLRAPLPATLSERGIDTQVRVGRLSVLWEGIVSALADQNFTDLLWKSRFRPLGDQKAAAMPSRKLMDDFDFRCAGADPLGTDATMEGLLRLRAALPEEDAGVMGIVLGHLLEAWIVRMFGDSNTVGPVIRALAARQPSLES